MRTQILAGGLCLLWCLTAPSYAQDAPAASSPEAIAQAEAARLAQAAQQTAAPETPPSAAPVQPAPTPTPEPPKSPLNFNNAELPIILKYIHEKTGKPVLLGTGLNEKKISLINDKLQTDQDNLRLLYRVLASNDIAVVESDDLIEILPSSEARKSAFLPLVGDGDDPSSMEHPVMYSHTFKNIQGKDTAEQLKTLVRDQSALLFDEKSNTLFYTELQSQVRKLDRIIQMVDREPSGEILSESRRIRNASAVEILEPAKDFLNRFAALRGQPSVQTVIEADPKTNTLMFRGPKIEVEALNSTLSNLDKVTWNSGDRVTVKRVLNRGEADAVIAQAKDYLLRYVAVAGEAGDVPSTLFRYEPLTKELLIKGPQGEIDAVMAIMDRLDPAPVSRERNFLSADRQPEIDRALELLKLEFEREGWKGFQPSITWSGDPFDSSKVTFSGPADQIDRFMALLSETLPTQERRTRLMSNQPADKAVPEALAWLKEIYAAEGRPDFQSRIQWETDPRNSAQIILSGPTLELDRLMPLLDKIDPPVVSRTRVFKGVKPDEAIPAGLDLVVDQFAKEGQAGYRTSTTWERDVLDPDQIVLRGPALELDRLFAVLDKFDPVTEQRTRRFYNRDPEKVLSEGMALVRKQYATQGRPLYKATVTWKQNDRNPAEYILEGLPDELTRLFTVLDELDKPTMRRTREIQHATPEEVIPVAIDYLIEDFAKQGLDDYKPSIQWERERFNPRMIVFTAPPPELEALFPILDQLDKPSVARPRPFYNRDKRASIAEAVSLMLEEYAREGRPGYRHSITWKPDLVNPAQLVFKGPQEELDRLFKFLDQIDKPTVERTREFYEGNPEEVIPVAIDLLISKYADKGIANYRPSIKWERETFNPKFVVFHAPAEELDILVPLLNELDPKVVTQRYAVINATPENLIKPAQELLKQYFIENNRPDYKPSTKIWVDERQHSLAFQGPEIEVTPLRTILTDLDRTQWQHQSLVTQKFPLGYAKAEDLISGASEYLATRVEFEGKPGDRPGVVFKTDRVTKSVLMYGAATQIQIAMEVMAELEKSAKMGNKAVPIYPKYSTASLLYTEITQALPAVFASPGAPVVLANDRLGMLLVSAKPEDLVEIRKWVGILDAPSGQNLAREIVRLKNADPNTLVGVLGQLVSGAGRMIPDARSNSLIIIDSTESMRRIMPFIEQLDQLEDTEKMVHEVVKLKTANASYLITPVQQYAAQLADQRGRSTRNRAIASYEPNSGSIILFGPEEDVAQIVHVIHDLDRVELAGREPKMFYLKNSEATNISGALGQILTTIFQRSQTPPVVVPVPRINALIVSAQEEVMSQVEDWIKKLDIPEGEGLELKVVKLESSGAAYIYGIVSQFKSPRGIVSYDANTNTIVLRDIPSTIKTLDQMIADLDKVGAEEADIVTQVRLIENAQVSYVYSGITNFLSTKASLQGQRARSGLYPEYSTNSILIFGPTDEIQIINDLIDKLDTPQLTDQDLKVFPLKHANASQLSGSLSYLLSYNHTGTKTPIVTYETQTNSILVQAHEKDFPKVKEFLDQFDQPKNKDWEIKVIPVEGMNAATLVGNLRHLLGPNVTFFPEANSNAIVVNAPPEEIAKVEELVAAVSKKGVAIATVVRELAHAQASPVYSAVTSYLSTRAQLEGRSANVGLYPEYVTNRLLIYGPTEEIRAVSDLIDRLDSEQLTDLEVRVLPVTNANAAYLTSPISTFLSYKHSGNVAPYVTYEPRSNSLIIQAASDDFVRVQQFLDQMDVPGIGAAAQEIRVVQLKNTLVSQVYGAVTSLLNTNYTGSTPPYVTYETNSNSLIVQAHSKDFERLTSLLKNLDVPQITNQEVRVFPIENAMAAYLTAPISTFLSYKHSGTVPPYVTYEPRSNSLIIQAASEDFSRVKQFLDQIDLPGVGSATQEIRVIQLKYAMVSQVYSAVSSILSSNYSGPTAPIVTSEYNSNSLIVQAHQKDFDRLSSLLKSLDVPQVSHQEVRIYTLKYAAAPQVSSVLTNILYYNYTGSTRPFVTYEANSNTVVVQAHADDFLRVEEVLKKIDTQEITDRKMRVFPLTHVRASQVQVAVYNMLYYTYTGTQRPYVAYEDTSNTLIIQGMDEDFLKVQEILKQLDVPGTAGLISKIVQLKYANARSLLSALTAFKSPRGIVQADDNTNSLILLDTQDALDRMMAMVQELDLEGIASGLVTEIRTLQYANGQYLASSVLNQIASQYAEQRGRAGKVDTRAYAEPNSNTIVVVGASPEVKVFMDLIDRFDQVDFAGGEPRFFPVKFTEATQLANQLSRLFQATARGRSGVQTEVVADAFTNSIIAIGTERDMKRVEDLIAKLDVPEVGGLELEIFQLEGVNAQTLAQGLQGLKGPSRGTLMYSDPNSNTLVVKDTPEVISQVKKIVEELRNSGGEVATQVVKLNYAEAGRIAPPLTQFVQMRATQEGLSRPRLNVSAETSTNSILIFGPTSEIQAVVTLIAELDTEEFGKVEPRIYPLQHVTATQLVSPITQLLRQTTVGINIPVVVAEPGTNALIVQAPEDDLKRVEELIRQLDTPQSRGLVTEVILLKNSSAQELASAIRVPTLSDRGAIFPAVGTNSLIVTDTPDAIRRVREIVDAVDSTERNIRYEVRRLENTTVGTLEPSLQRFLTHLARLKGVTRPLTELITDPQANTVVIYGPSDEADIVMGLLDELDSEDMHDREPGIFPLKNARAAQTVLVLQELLMKDRRGLDPNSPKVVADEFTNSIIVMATQGDLERAEKLIATLDQAEGRGMETRIFPVKNTSPDVLERSLRGFVEDPRNLFGDEASNSIVYTDTPGNLDRLGELIAELDQMSGDELPVSVVRSLKNSDAASAVQILNQFVTQRATQKGRRRPIASAIADPSSNSVTLLGPQEEVDLMSLLLDELDAESLRERTPVVRFLERATAQATAAELGMLMSQISTGPNAPRIVANEDSNALLILSTPADLAVIDEMIAALDSDSADLRRTHIYPLKNTDATSVLLSLRPMVGPTARITAHLGSNSIVYTDTEANVARVFDMIEKMDTASKMEDVVTQVIPLENANASAITRPLENIVLQVNTLADRGNKPKVQTYPDVEANTIVLIGAADDVEHLAQIVGDLDREAVTNREPTVFFLDRANSTEIAREIQQLYSQGSTLSGRVPPRIVANTWANAIMVFADPQDTQIIGKLVMDLDQSEGRRRVVKIFELENSDASVLAQKISELFLYGGVDARQGRSSRSYRYDYGGSGRRSEGLTEGQVAIIPDLRLNALIVTAEPQDIDQVEEIIRTLDADSTRTMEPKVFQLKNAEAETLAETLETLFADYEYQQGYYYSDQREVGVSALSGKIRVIPDPTTNTLIVLSSSPKAFEVVEKMINELDKPSIQESRTQIIKVNHADVINLSKTLTTLFKKEENAGDARRNLFFSDFFGGSGGGTGVGAGSFSNLIGKVRIEPDTRTSSLLVVTPEVFFPSVEKIVKTLDIPTKQIILEVLIAELTRNNERDLGFQWGVDPDTGEVGQITVNNQEIFNYDNDRGDFINPFTSPTDYASALNFTDPAQFITLNSTQFNVVLNFLQTCRDISIKQRPRVTAADNVPAVIRVGSETPFIAEINQSSAQTTTSVEYRPLGLTLNVTPHINSATEVTLDIMVKDGAVDLSVPPLAGLSFTFTDRQIETKAVVKDRHTVVLGGVIVEREREQVDQVPVLHRLPLVGRRLFSNENTVHETVELLTFITPYILSDYRDASLATEMIRSDSINQGLDEIDLENGNWPEEYADRDEDVWTR